MAATHHVEYKHNETLLEAYVAHPTEVSGKLPTVLIMHAWEGRNEFVEKVANEFAAKGYVGVALDAYGKGKRGETKEEKSQLMMPLMEDRKLLAQRLLAGVEAVKKLPHIDAEKMVAMGYCFGGLCALDLMRNAVKLMGVISIHGLLGAPDYQAHYHHATKVLALAGYNDPMVRDEQIVAFEHEMDKSKLDWQLVTYGNTMHAFTNPKANDKDFGTVYNPIAAKRSHIAIDNFIQECFQ